MLFSEKFVETTPKEVPDSVDSTNHRLISDFVQKLPAKNSQRRQSAPSKLLKAPLTNSFDFDDVDPIQNHEGTPSPAKNTRLLKSAGSTKHNQNLSSPLTSPVSPPSKRSLSYQFQVLSSSLMKKVRSTPRSKSLRELGEQSGVSNKPPPQITYCPVEPSVNIDSLLFANSPSNELEPSKILSENISKPIQKEIQNDTLHVGESFSSPRQGTSPFLKSLLSLTEKESILTENLSPIILEEYVVLSKKSPNHSTISSNIISPSKYHNHVFEKISSSTPQKSHITKRRLDFEDDHFSKRRNSQIIDLTIE